jgi:hypothetical protein
MKGSGFILKPNPDKNNYLHVILYKNKIKHTKNIHRLVAIAFIPNLKGLPDVNHIDGNKFNCHVNNLEWCTKSYNSKHAYDNNLISAIGEKNGQAKLTDKEVIEIRELKGKFSQQKISEMFGVSRQLISFIHLRKNWTHI